MKITKIAQALLAAQVLPAAVVTTPTITWTDSGAISGDTSQIITSSEGLLLFDQTEFTRDIFTGTTSGVDLTLSDGSVFTSADYATSLDYAHNFQASGSENLYFGGLTVGTQYTIQLFSSDQRNATTLDRTLVVNGDYIIASGDYATGTFTAASEYISINFYGSTASDPTATNNHVLNLVAIAGDVTNVTSSSGDPEEALPAIGVVPEPSSLALFGLGAFTFAVRRKR